jgi:hypothetical protein
VGEGAALPVNDRVYARHLVRQHHNLSPIFKRGFTRIGTFLGASSVVLVNGSTTCTCKLYKGTKTSDMMGIVQVFWFFF